MAAEFAKVSGAEIAAMELKRAGFGCRPPVGSPRSISQIGHFFLTHSYVVRMHRGVAGAPWHSPQPSDHFERFG
jgi:hypothetical protein